jgi:hypothetical protein
MTDGVQESAEEEDDTPGKDEKMRQARVQLAETPVLFIRPEKLAVDENIDKSRAAEHADALAEIIGKVGRPTDPPPAGDPDDSQGKDGNGDSGEGVNYPGVLNIPENLTGGFIHGFCLFPEKVILSAPIIT